MEDVLEQIVGEIEDEYDDDAETTIFQTGDNSWRAMAITEVETFNREFNTDLPHDDYDTLGGWLAAELERIPHSGDSITRQGLNFTVVGATRPEERRGGKEGGNKCRAGWSRDQS